MAMNVRHPIWLPAAPAPGISAFATLFFIETFARATLSTVVPLQAYDIIKNSQLLSLLYTGIALVTLLFSLILPFIIVRLSRRWTYTLGAVTLMVAALCFATYTFTGQVGGMLARVIGSACLNVTLSLYVLDYIRKQQFVRYDSVRLTTSTIGWALAPYMGVWLYVHYGPWATYGLSFTFACILVCVFWYLRLTDSKAIQPARQPPANPLKNVRRYAAQPRLRLAWIIAFGRSSYWSTLFIYGPILMVTSGLGQEAGGLLILAANALLITAMAWGRLAERWGVRRTAVLGFYATAACLFVAGYFGTQQPLFAAAAILAASFFSVPLDAVGSVPFYRAVHPYERAQMTSVYRTYLDFGELVPPLIYAILLGFFDLGVVFVALGFVLIGCGTMTWRFLNPRI
ncbi:MAG: MFS transporter [Rhizobiales bacterium]|nr:MFS transporter [Hyphomicrobiales bacterium]